MHVFVHTFLQSYLKEFFHGYYKKFLQQVFFEISLKVAIPRVFFCFAKILSVFGNSSRIFLCKFRILSVIHFENNCENFLIGFFRFCSIYLSSLSGIDIGIRQKNSQEIFLKIPFLKIYFVFFSARFTSTMSPEEFLCTSFYRIFKSFF